MAGLIIGSGDLLDGGLGVELRGGRRLSGPVWADIALSYTDLTAQTDGLTGERADNALLGLTAGLRLWLGGRSFGAFVAGRAGLAGVLQSLSGGSGVPTGRATRADWGLAAVGAAGLRVGLGDRVGVLGTAGIVRTGELEFVRTTASGGTLTSDLTQLRLGLSLQVFLP